MRAAFALALALSLVGAAAATFGYEYPLASEAIREACLAGSSSNGKSAQFFDQYTRQFSVATTLPYVATIEFETPFAVVADRARQDPNFRPPDAVEQFLGKRAIFRARIALYWTNTNGRVVIGPKSGETVPLTDDYWRQFKIRLKIEGKRVRPDSVRADPIYAMGNATDITGATVELTYSPEKIAAAPATITVTAPSGGKAQAAFDLSKLR